MAPVRFFDDDVMDFATRCVLSGVRHGMAEVGETLAAVDSIDDGDPESWLRTFVALGRRLRGRADAANGAGHAFSAWNAALRSANYLYAGLWWAPVTGFADEAPSLWAEHRSSWDLAAKNWPTPTWPVRLPHHSETLPGIWFTSPIAGAGPAPTVVIVQGLGTPISDLPMTGLDGALARGHHVLVFDGPGQGAALHRQALTLEPEWERVIASALDWLETRPEVDLSRITVSGLSHGALFAVRAAATDPRISALVLDPGVVDLGADAGAAVAAATTTDQRRLLAGTTTVPTGAATLEAAADVLGAHRIGSDRLADVRCPTLVVQAQDASSFCGQHATLCAGLTSARTTTLTMRTSEGAGMENGLDASQVHDAAVYDWLDATLGADDTADLDQGAST